MSSVFKSTNYGFLNCKLLHRVGWVGSESELCNLRRISVLGVRVIGSCRLLRAQLIITLDNDSSKLERRILVGSLDIDQKSGPARVIDTRLIIRGRLSFLGAASTRIVEHLQTSLASSRLFSVT